MTGFAITTLPMWTWCWRLLIAVSTGEKGDGSHFTYS